MHRIRWSITEWSERFASARHDGLNIVSRIPVRRFLAGLPMPPLPLSGWILAAADFHCCNIIPRLLAAEHGNSMMPRSPDTLKCLIWQFSSSVNTRRLLNGAAASDHHENEADRLRWEAIRVTVAKMQRAIVMENVSSIEVHHDPPTEVA